MHAWYLRFGAQLALLVSQHGTVSPFLAEQQASPVYAYKVICVPVST